MNQATGFTADPVVSKPASRQRTSDVVGNPVANEGPGVPHGAPIGQSSYYRSGGAGMHIGVASHGLGVSLGQELQPAFPSGQEGFQGNSPRSNQLLAASDWSIQQNQLQQMLDQQALLNQLNQMKMHQAGAAHIPAPQVPHPSRLAQQMQASAALQEGLRASVEMSHPSFGHQGLPPLSTQWPSHPRSPPTVPPSLPAPALSDMQGMKQHFLGHDDKKHPRSHSLKARQVDNDPGQMVSVEKLRRELARVQAELERVEKEVSRQKALRETERVEFTEAKDRLKSSWAADREDFARVKAQLKAKNSEHHAQSGRLSQQLKEMDAVNRSLREICARNGVLLPADITHSKHLALPPLSGNSAPSSQMSMSTSNPSSQLSSLINFEATPAAHAHTEDRIASSSDAMYDSDVLERSLGRWRASNSQPPSPTSASLAIRSMMQQLPKLLIRTRVDDGEHALRDTSESEAAAQAAANAATALGQLAAALSIRPPSPRALSPAPPQLPPAQPMARETEEGSCRPDSGNAGLSRMSLQSWMQGRHDALQELAHSRSAPGRGAVRGEQQITGLEFPRVEEASSLGSEASPFAESAAQEPPIPTPSEAESEAGRAG